MALQVETDGPGWKFIAVAAWSLITMLFGWIAKSLREEQRSHGVRINSIETTYVTRENLEERIERLERVSDRRHEENQQKLDRIDEKLERSSETRHDIRDSVHATQLMLRELLESQRRDD